MIRRCVNLALHTVLLLMVIELNHGKVARFLESEWQKPNLKRVRMPKVNTAFAPGEIQRRAVIARSRTNRP
jgi:hypothetical protein